MVAGSEVAVSTTRQSRTRKAAPERRARPKAELPSPPSGAFPIVGVGASAGGLDPFLQLLRTLGDHPALAVVFVIHQERHQDRLADVVVRATNMPVVYAEEGMEVESGRVYVAPSNAYVTLAGGRFVLHQRTAERLLPIDIFFRSLAEDQEGRAVSVVLSGSASDGTEGSKAVKAEGGITFAQDETAVFSQMPLAAIAGGSIDFVLSPEEIAQELLRISRHIQAGDNAPRLPEADLIAVFRLMRAVHDIDFTHYKPATVERRIRRRMALRRIDDLAAYIAILRKEPQELERLCSDILIRVTSFFRDPEVFDALRRDVFPALVRERTSETPVRVWVPGCATGEEVYSLAIALLETVQEAGVACPVQIFGTDVSDAAVERARLGIYGEEAVAEVSPERRRFFTRGEDGYRIAKAVRDCCVFAKQNLTRDPPFSRLDMISCRNVMIYLGIVLQRRVMSIFHYALKPNGYLLLGSSETIGNFGDLFTIVDRKNKVYQKKTALNRLAMDFESASPAKERPEKVHMEEEILSPSNVFREADRVMLTRFSPPAVLIGESMEVLQFRGRTGQFLEPPSGVASFNILKMAREGLLAELRAAIQTARRQQAPARRDGVRVQTDGGTSLVNIEVIPFVTPTKERYQIVLFEEVASGSDGDGKAPKKKGKAALAKEAPVDTRQVARLKRELEATREYLQSIIEEQEAMNDELRSANEEIQSSNEELQSTNEELETAKEELQSSNEELTTLNEELENRNDELADVNNDLVNLLGSVDLPIIMLDNGLRIRRFNPGAQRTLNLTAADVGRRLEDLQTMVVFDGLDQMIASVIDNVETREVEVQDRRGYWYSLRIRPYKTTDNKIDGAVLVIVDIDGIRRRNQGGGEVVSAS